jgi:hypothetical protein
MPAYFACWSPTPKPSFRQAVRTENDNLWHIECERKNIESATGCDTIFIMYNWHKRQKENMDGEEENCEYNVDFVAFVVCCCENFKKATGSKHDS